MPGYGKINEGYNEQYGINWGQVAAYTGGGIMAAGIMRMGAHRLNESALGRGARRGITRGMRGIKSGGQWANRHGRSGASWANRHGRSGLGLVNPMMGAKDSWGRATALAAHAELGRKAINARVGRFNAVGIAEARSAGKKFERMQGISKADMKRGGWKGLATRTATIGASVFGAMDLRNQGMKRAGAVAGRAGVAGLAIGAGVAAADFLNPFGFGWND